MFNLLESSHLKIASDDTPSIFLVQLEEIRSTVIDDLLLPQFCNHGSGREREISKINSSNMVGIPPITLEGGETRYAQWEFDETKRH